MQQFLHRLLRPRLYPLLLLKNAFWNRHPETLHRSGCFDSHLYIKYFVGCGLFTSLHGAPIRSYLVEADDKLTALQGGYGVFAVKLWGRRCFITCFYKTSAMKTYSHSVMSF